MDETTVGDALYADGDYSGALRHYARAVMVQAGSAELHYKLAKAAANANRDDLVESHFREALRLRPDSAAVHDGLAVWLLQSDRLSEALDHSAVAIRLDSLDIDFAITRCAVLTAARQEHAAWALMGPLISSGSNAWRLAIAYARLAPKLGHEMQAIAFIERAFGDPMLPESGRSYLHYAAASLLDRIGRSDEAFEQARRANQLLGRRHDPDAHSKWISAQLAFFTPERLKRLARATNASPRPVFIVGMPRSGTSLVEQILASHPQVFGAGELPDLGRLARATPGAAWSRCTSYPECLEHVPLEAANELGARYVSVIDRLSPSATYVTDKTPLNFLDLGFAQLVLPGCRVIHCGRDPRDTCLSCYLTEFAAGHAFTCDLAHLGRFYRDYRRLMDHWRSLLGLPILDVNYEDLVLDPPGQTRRLLEFLGLPWDDRCLRFFENPRRVHTASVDQVRQPIYLSSVGRWKHYEKHLDELMIALSGAIESTVAPRR